IAMNGTVEMAVYNMLGKRVWSSRSNDLIKETIDLSELTNGIYLMDIRSQDKIATTRFVIQK
ncbi:MAG: T9SS type A sorting domain-containing protein, partial [Flavobacteriales bacterium]